MSHEGFEYMTGSVDTSSAAVGLKVPADLRLAELMSNVFRVDQVHASRTLHPLPCHACASHNCQRILQFLQHMLPAIRLLNLIAFSTQKPATPRTCPATC